MAFSELIGLFTSQPPPVVVSDSPFLLRAFEDQGFDSLSVDSVCNSGVEAPYSVILIPAAPAVHPNLELREKLRGSAVLLIPLLAFSSCERSVKYLVSRLKNLCFTDSCKKSRLLVEHIQHAEEPIHVVSPGCKLTIDLGERLDVFAPKLAPSIAAGEWISIIQFLEVGIVPNEDDSSFIVNGTLLCGGVSVAHHLHSHFESGPPAEKAWAVIRRIQHSNNFPLILTVENSRMISVVTENGEDLLEELLLCTDKMMRGRLTEVGFGSLEPSSDTNWEINSQLNEPSGGVHLALGAGETAAHIDFVSPDAQIANFAKTDLLSVEY